MSHLNINKCGEYLLIARNHYPTQIISISKTKNIKPNCLEVWKLGNGAIVRLSKKDNIFY